MPYGPVRKSALKSYAAKGRRKRSSTATRVKMERPTAANQKRQIMRLSRQVARNTRFVASQKVFTDWQWVEGGDTGISRPLSTGTWYAWPLTDLAKWLPVLRQSDNSTSASKTYCARMQINCRMDIGDVLERTCLNVFLVSPRKGAIDAINVTGPSGAMDQLDPINDYIDNDQFPGANVRLNTQKFKVHAVKYSTLVYNTFNAPSAGPFVSNALTTYRKWQWNLPLKFTVRQPSGASWTTMPFSQMPYYQKYYLLVYSTSLSSTNGPNLHADALSTCINFA